MQAVLSQLNTLPGVVGSMVCSAEGQVLAREFPAAFAPEAVEEAARALTDGAQALGVGAHADDLLDFRFREVRLLARPFPGGVVAVLCSRATSVQFLVLSMTAAAAKLARGQEAGPGTPPPAAAAAPPSTPHGAPRRASGSGVAVPAKGLEELHRRLASPRAAGAAPVDPGAAPGGKGRPK